MKEKFQIAMFYIGFSISMIAIMAGCTMWLILQWPHPWIPITILVSTIVWISYGVALDDPD